MGQSYKLMQIYSIYLKKSIERHYVGLSNFVLQMNKIVVSRVFNYPISSYSSINALVAVTFKLFSSSQKTLGPCISNS